MSIRNINILGLQTWWRCLRLNSSSALFISDRNTKERPILTPSLNLDKKFNNPQLLQDNVTARGMDIDVVSLKSLFEVYTELLEVRTTLERRRVEIAEQIKQIKKNEVNDSIERLRLEGRLVREDLKGLLSSFWDVEEKLMTDSLLLPNDLHQNTPLSSETILEEFGTCQENGKNHLNATDLIDYRNPQCYYLKNEAAIFDLVLPDYFRMGLRSAGFVGMSGPDFAHTALVEGCGALPESYIRLEPTKNSFHLVGGSSLYPFCAFYAKQDISESQLPLRNVSVGRKYVIDDKPGLFGAWQRNCVDFVCVTKSPEEMEEEFAKIFTLLSTLYRDLGWNVRFVHPPAAKLGRWESLRLSIQMYSCSLKKWLDIGHVSISGSYIPERIYLKFERQDKSKDFCHVLSGTAVDVTTVLACIVEQNDSISYPSVLSSFKFT